jgi:LysM repeat protein
MAEQPEDPVSKNAPRVCPACGTRVAAQATTCLMCGASLAEEAEEAPEKPKRRLPSWVGGLMATIAGLLILSAGGLGFYALLTTEPPELTPTLTPSRTPTATRTPLPTDTPTPLATPTPVPPLSHQVQEGETLSGIVAQYPHTTLEEILALNEDLDPELLQLGQVILIPPDVPDGVAATSAQPEGPTMTPGDYVIHVVSPGETLSEIAEEYGVSIQSIQSANQMAPYEVNIQANQSLVIPMGTPQPSPTPTSNPDATATLVPPYIAPSLLKPIDGATFVSSDPPVLLQWTAVGILDDEEWYEVRISQPGGVFSSTNYLRNTSWRVPNELLMSAEDSGGEFRWQVRVVEEALGQEGALIYEDAGPPSQVRSFTWVVATPTPTATPRP